MIITWGNLKKKRRRKYPLALKTVKQRSELLGSCITKSIIQTVRMAGKLIDNQKLNRTLAYGKENKTTLSLVR